MKTLIVYKSKHGAAKKAAQELQSCLEADLMEAQEQMKFDSWDQIIFVGSVYAGLLDKSLRKCIQKQKEVLMQKRVSMLICGMNRDQLETIIIQNLGDAFYEQLYIRAHIGGRLDIHKLGFWEKQIIRMVNKKEQKDHGNVVQDIEDTMDYALIHNIAKELAHV